MSDNLRCLKFNEIDIYDEFFDSLKSDYKEFENWFLRKGDKKAYVKYDDNDSIEGFLYYKMERDTVDDIIPAIKAANILKIGTFKINPHGTRLGERFIKKSLDYAILNDATLCYVTIFDKQTALVKLFQKYGFFEYGFKQTSNGREVVFIKKLDEISKNIYIDYPLINPAKKNKYLLSIYPKYHSIMFPDSILKTEKLDILSDVTYTNSIHKIYVCRMQDVNILKYGDILIIYRTSPEYGKAEFKSVVTSICVVEEIKGQSEFGGFDDFYKYASKYSVFDRKDLKFWYAKGGCYTIKMTYNAALTKRINRHKMIEELLFDRNGYWGFLKITEEQFQNIIVGGEVDEGFIIN